MDEAREISSPAGQQTKSGGKINNTRVPQETVSMSEKEVDVRRYGVEIVAGRIERMKDSYLWKAVIAKIERDMNAVEPTDPDQSILSLLISAGVPVEQARKSAIALRKDVWEMRRANALFAKAYIRAISGDGDIEKSPEIATAMDTWISQFQRMCDCLRVNTNAPSAIDPEKTIIESYRNRVCPIPASLIGVIFQENVQGTVELDEEYGGRSEFGVYFPVQAELVEDGQGFRIIHDSDHTKIHEDSHFLILELKGKGGYFKDIRLATVGEGFAPIFEIWFDGSKKEGLNTLSPQALEKIDRGESPSALRNGGIDVTTQKFWQSAKSEGLIKEHSGTTRIAAEIMLLLKQNPDLAFADLFGAFIRADSFDSFLNEVKRLNPSEKSFDRFKESVSQLSRLARHHM